MPDVVEHIHAQYVDTGANIITTNSYAILDAPLRTSVHDSYRQKPLDWMELAGLPIDTARRAIDKRDAGDQPCAIAFSIGGDIERREQFETVELLLRVFDEHQPDIILFESLSVIEENYTLRAIEHVIDAGYIPTSVVSSIRAGASIKKFHHRRSPQKGRPGRPKARKLSAVAVASGHRKSPALVATRASAPHKRPQ